MTCRTHIVGANALALLITQPHDVKSLAVCMGAATIGGVISDLDIVTSDSHKYVDIFCLLVFIGLFIIGFLELNYHIGIDKWISKNSSYLNIIISCLLLVIVCFFGMHQPHRTFLHSFLGIFILSLLIYFAFKNIVISFTLGMLSHIFLDFFNKRGLQLFYPLKNKFSLKLCSYDGTVNNILFVILLCIVILELFIHGNLM